MKTRESGMPEESIWADFFNPEHVLDRLGFNNQTHFAVEFGCGHGTFTIPAAQLSETVVTFDIDPEMVGRTTAKAKSLGLFNVRAEIRDFIERGTGLSDAMADYAMLFNILHAEEPLRLLREACRVLKPGGLLGVMHWNYDPTTPRGPSMEIRPQPSQLRDWAIHAQFIPASDWIDLPPYHYGFIFRKPGSDSPVGP